VSLPTPEGTVSVGKNQVPASIWNVPLRRNAFFTGRDGILATLHNQLWETSGTALSQPLALDGLGGIGKTQTVVEYAYRYRTEYKAVCWVKASNSEELAEDFVSLVQLLRLPEKHNQEKSHLITTVIQWFETHTNWLLIFDNADDLTIIERYLPQENTGHILITTQAHAMHGIATKIEIPLMNDDEGTQLLLRRAGRTKKQTDSDIYIIREIIQELGGLALALDQAGAYLEKTQESLSSYLSLFKDQRAELLKQRGGRVSDHVPVATTWTLAFNNIEQSNPHAIELIRLCAFLAPDAIPEELIINTAKFLPSEFHPLGKKIIFNEAIATLLNYSLIQRHETTATISIHRLVQAVIRDEMKKTQQTQWAIYIVCIVSHVFKENELNPQSKMQHYLPHALISTEYIKQWNLTSSEARKLLYLLGLYLVDFGQYSEAEPLYQQNLAICKKVLGLTHFEILRTLNSLANLYNIQGKYEQAEPLFQQVLTIGNKLEGIDNPYKAGTLNNIADLYTRQGKYEQAESLFQQALAISNLKSGPKHPETAMILNNLARLYTRQGKYEQAEPLFQQALVVSKLEWNPQYTGLNHPDTATVLNNLAGLYTEQGKYEQAEPLFQQALTIRKQKLGPKHPDTAIVLNNLARFCTRQGKYEQAEPLFQQALAISKQKLGPKHPDTAIVLNNLASLYAEQGKYEQAEPLFQQALAISKQKLGPKHPDLDTILNNLASLYAEKGKYEQIELL
jgi:tetratricopeptide (TPR) repeat protein